MFFKIEMLDIFRLLKPLLDEMNLVALKHLESFLDAFRHQTHYLHILGCHLKSLELP